VPYFQQRRNSWGGSSRGSRCSWSWGGSDSSGNSSLCAFAASILSRGFASRLLALQLALGTSAVSGLDALVLAVQLFANRRALWIRSSACSVALRRSTNGFALGAAILLALILGATNRAHGAFAVDNALSTRGLFASHLALGASANRVADSWAAWVVALPLASGVALVSGNNHCHQEDKSESKSRHD